MMNLLVAVVLVAGVAFLARFAAGKRGYSHNQRIVLSAIAVGLLVWEFGYGRGNISASGMVLVFGAAVLLIVSVAYLQKQNR